MSRDVKPKYIAETKEEFEELEKEMKLFLNNYVLKLDGIAEINVRRGALEKTVDIFPNIGRIEEIVPFIAEPKGILRTGSPEYIIVEIEGYRFMIRYSNPDEKITSR
jgi:hypothetical protein